MASQLYCRGLTRVLQSLQKWYLAAVQCLTFNKKCLCCKDAQSWFRVPISQTKNMKWGGRKDISNARLRIGSCLCSLPIVILSSRWTIICWQMEANGKGCRKGVGPKNRLGLKLAGGLTGACFRIKGCCTSPLRSWGLWHLRPERRCWRAAVFPALVLSVHVLS